MNEAVKMVKVKIEQTKIEIDNRIAKGKRLVKQKKYEEAISLFKQAKEILRWMPYHVTDLKGKAHQLDLYIQRTEAEARKHKEDLKNKRMAEAEEQAKKEEKLRLKSLKDKIKMLFRQANLAFEREQYDLAENFCKQITVLEPDNQDAIELHKIVKEARHSSVFQTTRKKYMEEWKRVFEQVEEAMIPTQDIVSFPSYEKWKKISKRGSKGKTDEKKEESSQDRKIRERLETEVLSMDFTEAPLSEVLDFLRTTTGINIVIDQRVYKDMEEDSLKVNLNVTKLKLGAILNWILSLKGLAYKISNGVLVISTKTRVVEKPVLRLYNVRDLTGKLQDFPAQDINLAAVSNSTSTSGASGAQLVEKETDTATTITEEQLTELIKGNISKGTWDKEDRSIDTRHGTLIIRQTETVHSQIESLLNDLRRATGLLVTIEAKFITVSDDFLEDVGVDWRSLGGTSFDGSAKRETAPDDPTTTTNDPGLKPGDIGTGNDYHLMDDVVFGTTRGVGNDRSSGLFYNYENNVQTTQRIENIFDQALGSADTVDNQGGLSMQMAYIDAVEMQMILKAVRKRSRSNFLTAPRLTVFNTQRANVTIVKQIAYVQDYDVEIATNATIADPVIGTVQDGVVLDVRPIISADRKYITLELQPTVATLEGGAPDERRTELASSANSGPGEVRIQLPNITMTKIKTTVTIPDGGTILLGGLVEATRNDYMSGIPILSDLPIINFFTSRRGKYSHRENLLVLVTARITSMEEKEPNQGLRK